MGKTIIIAGASGMVGGLILKAAAEDSSVEKIISLVRRPSGVTTPKVTEVVLSDFAAYSADAGHFKNIDAAFFCVGAYTGSVPDEEFRKITVDYAVAFAETLKVNSPEATLCLLSGAGADRTGKSKLSFARYKGMAEDAISKMGLKFSAFRPGYIYPDTPRIEPNFSYRAMRLFYPAIKLLGPGFSIRATELAEAMFRAGIYGAEKEILENRDILDLLTHAAPGR